MTDAVKGNCRDALWQRFHFTLLYTFYNRLVFGIGVTRYSWNSAFASRQTFSSAGRNHES